MPKYLQLLTPHHRWRVPLQDVAEHRADNYEERGTSDWQQEVAYAMEDPFEATDWLKNNTNPGDFKRLKINYRDRVQVKDINATWPSEDDDQEEGLYEWDIVEEG